MMKGFFIVLFSIPALNILWGNETPSSSPATQANRGLVSEPRNGNEAMQQFKLAQKSGNLISPQVPHRDAELIVLPKSIQVDVSETSTAYQIMVHLTDEAMEEDFSLSYRDGQVKVRRKNQAVNPAKSSEVTVKLPGPGTASLVTRFTRDGKLIFNLPKAAGTVLGRGM
jgi:hypothetical protein